ncbi:MAG: TonB-dependent receptor [Bacteroidota bacterium]
MKRLFTTLTFLSLSIAMFAQGSVTGTLVDEDTGETLIGASILVKGTDIGTITDFDGNFTLPEVDGGEKVLIISYTGFATKELAIDPSGNLDLGSINMSTNVIGLDQVNVIASVAVDRKTPVAVSTIKGDVIEAKVGNQEFPEILRSTPSVYVTKAGGGFGDSRINLRGFDQVNIAVMINGIPVNDMENGLVYWSNWAGLSDVTSRMQVQRGLGASKLAVPSVGGSINIITNAAEMNQGGSASVSFGNDGYQKYGIAYNSGLNEKGWAFSFQGTHTRGDGYVDGTMFRAWSYFASISKTFNDKHMLSLTTVGAPQWHHQRLIAGRFDNLPIRTFVDPDDKDNENPTTGRGIRFNHTWGTLNGEEFNWRRNFYHKPKVFINHYWTISPKTDLKTSAYVSVGRGGGTGPRGRLRTPSSIFDSFGGFGTGTHNEDGQVRFDDIVAYNSGKEVTDWGTKAPNADGLRVVTNDGRDDGSGFIRRASMNYHNWYGILSTLTHKLNSNFNLVAGIDGRYYLGEHYRRVENLLGADAYLSRADDNNPQNIITETAEAEFGNFYNDSYKNSNNVINYWNDGQVGWLGLFTQLEYSTDKLSAFISLSGSNQSFKRVDYFNYLESDPERETDWQNFLGGTIKAGANYNINEQHNVFFNAGFISRQPIFDNVFLNFRNDVNEDVKNQDIRSFELGYGFRSQYFNAKVNLYSTYWGNRQFSKSFRDFEYEFGGETLVVEAAANFENVNQSHSGLEIELEVNPTRNLSIRGMASFGNWIFTENFTADLNDTDNARKIRDITIFAKDLEVGDAAQTTFSLGASYEVIQGLRVYADYFLADRLFAEYDVNDAQFEMEGAEVVEVPSYSLVDAGISYTLPIGKNNLTFRFNINNVFDEIYIAELDTNILDDPNTEVNELYDNNGIFGFGRTWNAGIKFRF